MRNPIRRPSPDEPEPPDVAPPEPPEPPDRGDLADRAPDRLRPLVAAVLAGEDIEPTAELVGARYAAAGEGLDVCLAEVDEALREVRGAGAGLDVVRSVALAWADATQEHYNCLTCADPFTGLSSLQHAQANLASLYDAAAAGRLTDPDIAGGRTLVVVEMPTARERSTPSFAELENSLRAAAAGELIAELVSEAGQPAQLNSRRIVAVAPRSAGLPHVLAQLSHQLDGRLALSPSGGRCVVWTESLPTTYAAASHLLDELAR